MGLYSKTFIILLPLNINRSSGKKLFKYQLLISSCEIMSLILVPISFIKHWLGAFKHKILQKRYEEDITHTSSGSTNHSNILVISAGIALKLEKVGPLVYKTHPKLLNGGFLQLKVIKLKYPAILGTRTLCGDDHLNYNNTLSNHKKWCNDLPGM